MDHTGGIAKLKDSLPQCIGGHQAGDRRRSGAPAAFVVEVEECPVALDRATERSAEPAVTFDRPRLPGAI